jgi:hypothetical protein
MSNLAWDYNILLTPALLSQGKKYRFLQQIGKIPGMKKLQISDISKTFSNVVIISIYMQARQFCDIKTISEIMYQVYGPRI